MFKSKKKAKQAKILVVDDEPDYINAIQCRLEWHNYEVVIAANGREGLEKAASEKPDLILLDTGMPVMNGHEMLERLRTLPELKGIPVIMVTALCDEEDIAKASSCGISDYVAKPFDFTELIEKIAQALEKKKASVRA